MFREPRLLRRRGRPSNVDMIPVRYIFSLFIFERKRLKSVQAVSFSTVIKMSLSVFTGADETGASPFLRSAKKVKGGIDNEAAQATPEVKKTPISARDRRQRSGKKGSSPVTVDIELDVTPEVGSLRIDESQGSTSHHQDGGGEDSYTKEIHDSVVGDNSAANDSRAETGTRGGSICEKESGKYRSFSRIIWEDNLLVLSFFRKSITRGKESTK